MLEVSEIGTQRFAVALELLCEGQSFSFKGVSFFLNKDSILDVCINSSKEMAQITKDSASRDFEHAVEVFDYLKQNSSEFNRIVENYEPRYALLEDYGTGVVELAKMIEDGIAWNYGNPGPKL